MKLSKKGRRIIFGILLFLVILIVINLISGTSEAKKFKREYEALNDKKVGDYKYQRLKIPKKNKIKYISLEESIDIIENKTGLIYFGFPDCPWCRGIITPLIETSNNSSIPELYYVDITGLRDEYTLNDGNITNTKEASENYLKLLSLIDAYLDDYIITDDDEVEYNVGEKRLYVPFILAVNDGIITSAHSGSVELEENQSPYDTLTDEQKNELKVIFQNMVDTISVK